MSAHAEVDPGAFTELVAAPTRGRIFRQSLRPSLGDCAPSGRIRLDALARWFQDIAYFDVQDAGLADLAVWVVRRTRVRVNRFPQFGELHDLSTFCSGFGRMWAERRTSVASGPGGPGDIEAVSLWVHLDPASRRPTTFSEPELATYGEASGGRRVTARLKHPAPVSLDQGRSWLFRATECDVAGHVNNAAYWAPLEEELLSRAELESVDVEIEFRTPAQPGEKRFIAEGDRRWIVDRTGEVHASMALA